MSGIGPRDPAADARRTRRGFLLFGAVAAAGLLLAASVLLASREPDLDYTYTLTFTEDAGHPYTLLLPLPQGAAVSDACRYLGNGTHVREDSPYGEVMRVESTGDSALRCSLSTFEPSPLHFTTEGSSAGGRAAVRIFMNTSGTGHHPAIDLAFRELGKQWTTTRYVQGDLFDGWTTIEVREVVEPTPDHPVT